MKIEDRGFVTPCWTVGTAWYGNARSDGRTTKAHRASYEKAKGPIPSGMDLDHLCRIKSCINPDHLEPVSRAVNSQRGSKAKLTSDFVVHIRRSKLTTSRLAKVYGVAPRTIAAARYGKTWGNVDEPIPDYPAQGLRDDLRARQSARSKHIEQIVERTP